MMMPQEVRCLCSPALFQALKDVKAEHIEEIRVRIGRKVECIASSTSFLLSYRATVEDGLFLMNQLSQYSLYTIEEELKRGYVTIEGGHRIGLAGRVITEGGQVKMIRDVASFNIRIARDAKGIGIPYLPYLYQKEWLNTMVIGPPQSGKTTFIRDMARVMSKGYEGYKAVKVGVVDERSEIAGCIKGVPTFDLGHRIDVLDSCPKSEGMMMMIRSMSPEVLIVDEIGRKEDGEALLEAIHAGISIFVTAHGRDVSDVCARPTIQKLFEEGAFSRVVVLSRAKNERVSHIYDGGGNVIFQRDKVLSC